jgi:beta-lactamase class A
VLSGPRSAERIRHLLRGRSPVTVGLAVSAALLAGCAGTGPDVRASPSPSPSSPLDASVTPTPTPVDRSTDFAALEQEFDARLGVFAVDTGTGAEVGWRDDERFAYASTVKALAAAAVLDEVGVEGLDRPVPVAAADIVPHSPITETRVGSTMTVEEIASAATSVSDNTAANLLLAMLGGPQSLDDALTAIGDEVTVVTRTEPDLNEAAPGDERDTTSPRAFAGDLREYALGDTLDEAERARLATWMTSTRTGDSLVRADLPSDWLVGDKSGAGRYASRGDIAVIWPTDGAPIVIAVLSSRGEQDDDYDDRLIARAAALAVDALRRPGG